MGISFALVHFSLFLLFKGEAVDTTAPTPLPPTNFPTFIPTEKPSSLSPTYQPSTTSPATVSPTTLSPSHSPITFSPTHFPTLPTSAPTSSPTHSPTKPTLAPSFSPSTNSPSFAPTYAPTQCPIYCLERDGPVYCPNMHMTCDNGGYFAKSTKCGINDLSLALFVNPLVKYQNDFSLLPKDSCICPSGYRGYSCSVPLPETCTKQNKLFDGSFGVLTSSPTKTFYCRLKRTGLAGLMSLIHHRMELIVHTGGHNVDFTVHTRRPRDNSITTNNRYDNVTQQWDWINAKLSNCSVEFTNVDDTNAKTVKWTCLSNKMSTCESRDDGRNPGFCSWFYTETLANINPRGIAIAEFKKVNDSFGEGSGSITLPFGGSPLALDFECDAGVCVDDLDYSNNTLSEADLDGNKTNLLVVLGSTLGTFGAVFLALGLGCFCWRKKKAKEATFLNMQDETSSVTTVFMDETKSEEDGIGLVWENISYSILASVGKSTLTQCMNKKRKLILTSQYGMVLPGEVCAILGPSGAGKTSLLNLLADRREQNNEDAGEISLIGKGVEGIERRDVISYVQQYDSLMSTQTVRESLRFSAMLRIPHASRKAPQIEAKINDLLRRLKISHIADTVIGTHEKGGISGGERKRVDIGIELITSPSLLLLDEPTSGLDSNNVENFLEVLRAVARVEKCAVLLTIHQVSAKMFMAFDQCLIVTNHGEMAYFGKPANAVVHCKKATGAADDSLFGPLDNPAEVLLQQAVHTSSGGKSVGDESAQSLNALAHTWAESDERRELLQAIRMQVEKEERQKNDVERKKSIVTLSDRPVRAFPVQFYYLFQRALINLSRDMSLLILTVFFSTVIAIFVGCVFWKIDDRIPGLQNRFGLMFFLCIYFCLTSLSSLGKFVGNRTVFQREIVSGYYRVLPYYLSECFTDLLALRIVPPVIFALILTEFVGLQHTSEKIELFISILILLNLVSSAMCLMVSAGSQSIGQANYIAVLITIVSLIFGGLILSNDSASSLAQIKTVSFIHYAYESLMANELHGKDYFFNPKGYGLDLALPGDIYLSNYGMSYSNLTPNLWNLAAFFVVFLFVGYLFLLDIYGFFRRLLARRHKKQRIRSSGVVLSEMKKTEGSDAKHKLNRDKTLV